MVVVQTMGVMVVQTAEVMEVKTAEVNPLLALEVKDREVNQYHMTAIKKPVGTYVT